MFQVSSQDNRFEQAQQILTVLSTLNHYGGELQCYLREIASGVSSLICLDGSVVTLCKDDTRQVMASNLAAFKENAVDSLRGTLCETVVKTGTVLAIDNLLGHPGAATLPQGYLSYLGIPMTNSMGETIGTICSFSSISRQFAVAEIRVVELFAERAVVAIENHLLFHQLRHLNEHLETEVMQRTAALREAQARLIEKERLAAIGEFAAMIVHEIRNPVTTILMGLSSLRQSPLGNKDQKRVAFALEETERLENLVKEILLHSKPQVLNKICLDINQLMASMLERLQAMPAGAERRLVFEPAPSSIRLLSDRDKLKQVIINLVRNAFEASEPGETVTYRVLQDATETVCVQVHNGGAPIPPDILPLLNRPFHSTKLDGTGLGLAVVRRIVAAHGGTFTITSAQESGTLATVRLPITA